MASTFSGSPQDAVDLISKGIRHELEVLLREKLMAYAREILEPTVKLAAQNLVARVQSYSRIEENKTEVHVAFNTRLPLPPQ